MLFTTASLLATLSWLAISQIQMVEAEHGDGDEGTIMGPAAFLWPEDRNWNAAYDNIGPCGSAASIGNRTIFPLRQGSVALTIADEAYSVALYIAFDNNPTTQSAFQEQIVTNITEIFPGHQCYKVAPPPSSVIAGTNATIQLEYWAVYEGENNGHNESFYACADITFVEVQDFNLQVPCFNVTAIDFNGGSTTTSSRASSTPTPTATNVQNTSSSSPTPSATSSPSEGLSGGAKAGIAVGTIVGVVAIIAVLVFGVLRKRGRAKRQSETEAYRLKQLNPST